MFTGFVLGIGIAALLYYVHKVGLPKVLAELKQGRIEAVAAIRAHTSATTNGQPSAAQMARNNAQALPGGK